MGFVLCFDFEKFRSVEQKGAEGEGQNVILEVFFRQVVRSSQLAYMAYSDVSFEAHNYRTIDGRHHCNLRNG